MKFMMIVKHKGEKSGMPPKKLMEEIERLGKEQEGTMLGSGGLLPTDRGARVKLANGQISVVDGPFTEAKEIIGGFAQFEMKSREEAVESARRFMELHQKYWPGWEGETEVREMMEPGDFPQQCPK